MQTSREVNQSVQPVWFNATEAGSTDQRRLGLSLSNDAVTSPRVMGPTAEVVLTSSSLLHGEELVFRIEEVQDVFSRPAMVRIDIFDHYLTHLNFS